MALCAGACGALKTGPKIWVSRSLCASACGALLVGAQNFLGTYCVRARAGRVVGKAAPSFVGTALRALLGGVQLLHLTSSIRTDAALPPF